MGRPRTSIAALACLVFVCAMAFASLRHASLGWSRTILAVTLGVLGLACLRAFRGRAEQRPFWVGFVVVGGVYLLLTLSPGLGDRFAPSLPTTRLLERLYPHLYVEPRGGWERYPDAFFREALRAWSRAHPLPGKSDSRTLDYDTSFLLQMWVSPTLMPFERAGHTVLALVFAWLGGCLASLIAALAAPRRRAESTETSPSDEPGGRA